jgi:hypothetical protein
VGLQQRSLLPHESAKTENPCFSCVPKMGQSPDWHSLSLQSSAITSPMPYVESPQVNQSAVEALGSDTIAFAQRMVGSLRTLRFSSCLLIDTTTHPFLQPLQPQTLPMTLNRMAMLSLRNECEALRHSPSFCTGFFRGHHPSAQSARRVSVRVQTLRTVIHVAFVCF